MKRIIRTINEKSGYFTCLIEGKLVYFYLTKALAKKFMDYLDVGVFVEFSFTNKRKVIDKVKCFKVKNFTSIERKTYRTTKLLYSIKRIKEQIKDVLLNLDNLLFLDLEMTMPPYKRVEKFNPEIIQVGYFLTDRNLNILKNDGYYLLPTGQKIISKRTFRFLKITPDALKDAKDYNYFYSELKSFKKNYKPKIITWGKNDYLAIKKSFSINQKAHITTKNDYIDLLQIVKIYFNLVDDIGLFTAYKQLFNRTYEQDHDAYSDAYIMMKVFMALKSYLEYQ